MTPAPAQDRFDAASRYLIKLQPAELIQWRLKGDVAYRRWLDTRNLPFPDSPPRVCDTVARCEEASGQPWAMLIESQTEPDPDMFGRVLSYLGDLSLEKRPDEEPGSRFKVEAVIINLTGRGNTSRDFRLGRPKVTTCLTVDECNLAGLKAPTILKQINDGEVPRSVLGWIPLMQKGADRATLSEWLRIAEAETQSRRRGDYRVLAEVFAELAGCLDPWRSHLEGWNVRESQVVNQFINEGVEKGRLQNAREALRLMLEDKFGALPDDVNHKIVACTDPQQLMTALRKVPGMRSLDKLKL